MKVKCPKCKEKFDIDKNSHDEGDSVECPECGASSILAVKKGIFHLEPEESKYDKYEEEFLGDEDYEA